ncbi:TPA: hypothetical protein JBF46_00880 [Legionella pneumophila]|nr:hypothetical protein C3926_00890 [Legionella pneumophila]HCC3262245.1 hypothetical protein [Legionella pneumophila subsp. pneumophila]HAT3844134.1 hypothetical protein [Legionella pneumophila]HAU0263380.1 hypothetical protein [Legionella pneumophila]HAU0297912.1 hypothetical protein [Legionella pneumophila]
MPSEKSRYLNRGPSPLIEMNQLKQHLGSFTKEHLIDIIWFNAQTNLELWKALNAHIGIQLAQGDWGKAKAAIDYALYFSDIVGYSERGHDIIIYEILAALDSVYKNGHKELAFRVAEYVLKQGQEALDNFDDDWSWSCALEDVARWISQKKELVT